MSQIHMLTEAARQTPVIDQVDVLVAGGGPAGLAAALASARAGARTMLVERYGYLGGMITGANVVAVLGCGDGRMPKVRGITLEIRRRLEKLGAVTATHECGDYSVDVEVFKWQAAEMLLEAGVKLQLHTLACEPITENGRVAGVLMESKSGRQAVRAAVVVDATADADLAWRAGCPCDTATHEVTLVLSIAGIDKQRVEEFRTRAPEEHQAVVDEATRLNGGVVFGRTQLLKGVDVTDAAALTKAETQLRRECFAALTYLKAHMPGYQGARVAVTYPQLGVRLSRQVHGVYVLTDDDLKSSRHFEDGVARMGVYFPDWGPTYAIQGLDYDLPYRCLVPEGVDGLLVVGRCVSADRVTANTLRLLAPCLATGQAGGVAAAIAVDSSCAPRSVPVSTLRTALRGQDIFLG
jgi:ribulose 1,5-bisphosphate synthetase/thiazole synthase